MRNRPYNHTLDHKKNKEIRNLYQRMIGAVRIRGFTAQANSFINTWAIYK